MKYGLTKNALIDILTGHKVDRPVFQILGSKKLNVTSPEKDRYRLILSDGDYSINFAIMTTQVNSHVDVEDYTVIKVKNYVLNDVTTKVSQKVLLVMDKEIVASGPTVGETIGNPTKLTDDLLNSLKSSNSTSARGTTTTTAHSVVQPQRKMMKVNNGTPSALNTSISECKVIYPIIGLTPYSTTWVIKARVSNKSDIRKWSNSRGEGRLFSADLFDDTGEIRCTFFHEFVDKFYDLLQVDKVYYISQGQLKEANKQFNSLKNDYEMTVFEKTEIEECKEDDGDIPQVTYDFVSFDKIATMDVGSVVDIIGVCKQASDVRTFTSKSTNRELKKREVLLIDQSCSTIALALWGSQAETFDGSNNPVVVIKGAKIGEFGGGKNLSIGGSQVKLNPDIKECHRIKGWYDLEGRDAVVNNISEMSRSGNFNTPWLPLREVKQLGHSEKGDYFQTFSTILLMRSENAIYKACPTADCNKKVVDLNNGMYRCEKCNREFPNYKFRLLVSMNIADPTANQWVTLFTPEAEKILGKTSQEVGDQIVNSGDASKIFQEAHFKQYVFKCRSKLETYNDEQRLKTVVVKVDSVDYEEFNNHVMDNIMPLMQRLLPSGTL